MLMIASDHEFFCRIPALPAGSQEVRLVPLPAMIIISGALPVLSNSSATDSLIYTLR